MTMELLPWFISKNEQRKLCIIEQLEPQSVTFSTLEKYLGLSKRKIKKLANDLASEIHLYSSNCSFDIIIDKECICFSEYVSSNDYVKFVNNLRKGYLLASSLFQAVLFVFERRRFTILSMANELCYSESYSYKLFSKLKRFLDYLNVDIQLTKTSESMIQLIGDESIIRIFHYLVISNVSKGDHWIFKTIHQKEIVMNNFCKDTKRYENLSPIGNHRINNIFSIYHLALINGCRVCSMNKKLKEVGEIIEKDLCLHLKYLEKGSCESSIEIHEEILHLAFFISYFTQEIRTEQEKVYLGKQLYSIRSNPIVKTCINILDSILKNYSLPQTHYYSLLYSLCSNLVVIHHLGFYKFMHLYKVPPIVSHIGKIVENSIDKSIGSYKKHPSFTTIKYNFTQIISSYLIMLLPMKQKIYIEFFHRPEYKSVIENAIKYNYNSNVLQITDSYFEADIIISDTHGYLDSKFFYFKDVFDQNSWGQLGDYLNQVISQEIIEESGNEEPMSMDNFF